MVGNSLVESDIQDGYRLLFALRQRDSRHDGQRFMVKTAFWLYDRDLIEWRLIIATPLVDQKGPFRAYQSIQEVLRTLEPTTLSLMSISVRSPKDKIVKAVRKVHRVKPGLRGVRLGPFIGEGTYVEDTFLYAPINKAA